MERFDCSTYVIHNIQQYYEIFPLLIEIINFQIIVSNILSFVLIFKIKIINQNNGPV